MMKHGHGISHSLEVVETVLGVADVAWSAIDRHRHAHHPADQTLGGVDRPDLVSENLRLKGLLRDNLALLQKISDSPNFPRDCPPDLHTRLVAAVNSLSFLGQLDSLQEKSKDLQTNSFPFTNPTESDMHLIEVMVNGHQPSIWVWVSEEMVPSTTEEFSGIDNENYIVVSEELVVDGVANFIARCVLANPKSKNLTPEELQKTVTKALGEMNGLEKMSKVWHAAHLFYAIATWGITLAGLYHNRAVVKAVVKGIHTSGKVIGKAL